MKIFTLLIVFCFLSISSFGAKHQGYYVSNDSDTIHTTFRMAINMAGEPNLKRIRKSIRIIDADNKKKRIYPHEVKYLSFYDTVDSFNVEIVSRNGMFLFAYGVGKLSVYITEFDDAIWILNRYQSPTKDVYFIELDENPLWRLPGQISNKNWIELLDKDYPEFVECLKWKGKKKREMRRNGSPCFWEGKSLYSIIELFNKKYS